MLALEAAEDSRTLSMGTERRVLRWLRDCLRPWGLLSMPRMLGAPGGRPAGGWSDGQGALLAADHTPADLNPDVSLHDDWERDGSVLLVKARANVGVPVKDRAIRKLTIPGGQSAPARSSQTSGRRA